MAQMDHEVRPDDIEGDRGLPSVNERARAGSGKRLLGLMFLLGIAALGLGAGYFWIVKRNQAAETADVPKDQLQAPAIPQRTFTDAPPPPPEAPQEAVPGVEPIPMATQEPEAPRGRAGGPQAAPKPQPRLDAGTASLMVVGGGAGPLGAGGLGDGPAPAGGAGAAPGAPAGLELPKPPPSVVGLLGQMLNGTQTGGQQAGMLSDRNMTLAKGAFIDCVLQTKLDTTQPGMASCMVTRNVFSDNGKVVLIERGSTVVGEYERGLQQGQNRVFVLWTRVKTPNGVTMNLDSPGTDPLGASGLPGKVNNHFFQRFGAALLLSVIDGALDYASARRGSGDNNINYYSAATDRTSDLSDKILEKTINIPPTLYKNQGERINIFVARDLYFGNVYALRPNN